MSSNEFIKYIIYWTGARNLGSNKFKSLSCLRGIIRYICFYFSSRTTRAHVRFKKKPSTFRLYLLGHLPRNIDLNGRFKKITLWKIDFVVFFWTKFVWGIHSRRVPSRVISPSGPAGWRKGLRGGLDYLRRTNYSSDIHK